MADRAHPFIAHLRWRIIVLFFFATIISYIDRQTLSVNAPYIRRELRLSAQHYSYLVTAFLIAYTIGPTIAGRLVDTIGTRLGMAAAIAWWSVAATLHAFSRGAADLLALRFALGLGEAGTLPSTMRAVAEWFPARERSLATGIFTAGTAIGAGLAVPVVAFLTLTVGWRACFLVTGLAGFVWLLPWWRLYRPPESHPRLSPAERELILRGRPAREPASRVPITTILRVRKAWGVILGRLMVDPVWQFYLFWLPTYLTEQRGFSLGTLGAVGWLPFLATDAGSLTGGWLSGRLLARTGDLTRARRLVLLAGAVGALFSLPVAYVPGAALGLACICLATFSIGLWAPTALTLCADLMPPAAVGTMTGLSSTGAGIGGILFTLLIGRLADRNAYWAVFLLAATLPLVGFVLIVTLVGRVERVALDPDRQTAHT